MAAKKTPKKQSKSDFIRQQPASLSAAEVVAKAKGAGIALTDNLVYMVRGPRRGKSKTQKKGAALKKTASTTKPSKRPATQSKADFVRARPHLSPKEIVEDAKVAGVKLDATYVYNVRGYDKTAAKQKRTARGTSTGSKSTSRSAHHSDAGVEALLKAVAAELGLGRSIEILQAERARVRAVIGG
jgi:hypothetical protein